MKHESSSPSPERPRLFAVVLAGPVARDPGSSLRNLSFADGVAVVARDGETARAYRDAGAPTVLELTESAELGFHPSRVPGEILKAFGEAWVLLLDGEERVSLELRGEITKEVSAAGDGIRAFSVPVTRYVCGKYLRHGGWPKREVRIFRLGGKDSPSSLSWMSSDAGGGAVRVLKKLLVSLGDRRICERVSRINRVSEVEKHRAGKVRPFRILLEPLGIFLKRFFLLQGFRDGVPGLFAASLASLERFVVLAKGWERRLEEERREER